MTQAGRSVNSPSAGTRNPAMASSQRAVTAWMTGANCATRPDLPWLADVAPTSVIQSMAAVCQGCPVMTACDAFVDTMTGTEMDVCAGFWAGKYRNTGPQLAGDLGTLSGCWEAFTLPGLELPRVVTRGVAGRVRRGGLAA